MNSAKNHAEVLDRVRRALAFTVDRVRGALLVEAVGQFHGLPAGLSWHCHADGRLVERVACRIGCSAGFDGQAGWCIDPAGWPVPFELEDLEVLRVSSAIWSGRWLLPDTEIEISEAADRGRHVVLHLGLRTGRSRFRLSIEASTGCPVRLEEEAGHESAWLLSDYRPGPWAKVAHRIVRREGWLEEGWTITAVRHGETIDETARAQVRPEGTSFDRSVDALVTATVTPRGRLPLVHPRIEGRTVGPFLLDTGAGALAIDRRVADALGLESFGRTWIQTADGGTGMSYRAGSSLGLGPLTMRDPVYLEAELEALGQALGVRLAGVCGYDLFARAVVRIAQGPLRISVHAPEDDGAASESDWQPLRFESRRPLIGCSCERGEALLALDSGSSMKLLLYAARARRWQLPLEGGRVVRARGLTGSQRVVTRRMSWLSLGGQHLTDADVAICVAREGPAAHPAKHGVIGWGLLKHFDVTLDYARRRLALRRMTPSAPRTPRR